MTNRQKFRDEKLPSSKYVSAGDEILGPVHTMGEQDDAIQKLRAMGHTEFQITSLDIVCDFCSHPVTRWRYSIPPGGIVVSYLTLEGEEKHGDMDGLWGACEECHGLIQERNWHGLAFRSYRMWAKAHPEMAKEIPADLVATGIVGSHSFFAERWDGSDPEPEKPDEDFIAKLDK
jgi:hypothetical protein